MLAARRMGLYSKKLVRRACAPSSRLEILEPLEARALLSASIIIAGNTHVIPFGDNSPGPFDFTDFGVMSITADATIGTVSRTYVIANSGSSPLIQNGNVEVTLSGPNATDFIVSPQPPSIIAVDSSSTFTIQFAPRGVGTRTAKVTIHTNDPDHPAYTFAIKGTGLKTNNDSANHLQVATTHAGTGTGAINGNDIVFDYVGTLLDGTIFDSSTFLSPDNRGHSPIDVVVGAGKVVPGLDEGLAGIKVGETRVVIMPAALGYGDDGQNNVPGGASLIFTVTRRKTPTIGLQGNGTNQIAFNETDPSPDDGTYIGTIPANSTLSQLSATYQAYQVNSTTSGFLSLTSTKVRITGPQASDFSSSLINLNNASFTITYTPKSPRNSTAVVHVMSTDPDHKDFSFTIGATQQPFNDLSMSLGHARFPSSGTITSGAATKYAFPIIVTNHGNVPVPSTPLDLQLYLHNFSSGQYSLLTPPSFTTTAFKGLAPGSSRTLTLSLPIPISVTSGIFDMLAKVDNADVLHETNTDNNADIPAQQIHIIQGVNSFTGHLVSQTPNFLSIAANTAINGSLKFTLTSSGNLALPAGQQLTLQVVAIDTHTQSQMPLGPVSKVSVAGWSPGRSGNFAATEKLSFGLAAGTYHLGVIVSPTPALPGVANFVLSTDGNGDPITLTVT